MAVAEVTGPDRAVFLDAQFPQSVASLEPGHALHTALLDRKARVRADLLVLDTGESLWLVARRDLLPLILETLEQVHIREKLAFTPRPELQVWELHGPATPAILAAASGGRPPAASLQHAELPVAGRPVRFLAHPWTGDVGGRLFVSAEDADRVREALVAAGLAEGLVALDADALEILRIEGGQPSVGVETSESTLLPELGRDDWVASETGCYPGQETVARVRARGRVNRLLLGVEIEGETVPEPGTLLLADGDPVGETASATRSPSLDRVVALAMIRTRLAGPGDTVHLRLGGALVAGRIRELPLYATPGPGELAERLYREGLEFFKADRFEDALGRFERATLMDPARVDAFESIGVCQEKLGRLDEAIVTMEGLTEMDPENVMAWTNLSRYHARQGRIEKAEEIKGHVTFLVWKAEAGRQEAERRSREAESRRRADLEDRIGLFEQVLEIDPDDVVANFGLGKLLLDLERYEEAVPRFRKAVERQTDYSMAYNHLGTCLAKLGRGDDAASIFRQGIEAATRRGDFVPKQDMARKLAELTGTHPG
jgi:folate-binding protein YgfZ